MRVVRNIVAGDCWAVAGEETETKNFRQKKHGSGFVDIGDIQDVNRYPSCIPTTAGTYITGEEQLVDVSYCTANGKQSSNRKIIPR